MEKINGLIKLLGEENVDELKRNIVEVITEQIRDDLRDYGSYLLYPPDMQDIVRDAMESTEKKVAKMYKDAVIEINQDYIDKMKKYMTERINDPIKDMRREIIDLAKRLQYCGYYGRDEAGKLLKIVGMTQDEIIKQLEDKEDE